MYIKLYITISYRYSFRAHYIVYNDNAHCTLVLLPEKCSRSAD